MGNKKDPTRSHEHFVSRGHGTFDNPGSTDLDPSLLGMADRPEDFMAKTRDTENSSRSSDRTHLEDWWKRFGNHRLQKFIRSHDTYSCPQLPGVPYTIACSFHQRYPFWKHWFILGSLRSTACRCFNEGNGGTVFERNLATRVLLPARCQWSPQEQSQCSKSTEMVAFECRWNEYKPIKVLK